MPDFAAIVRRHMAARPHIEGTRPDLVLPSSLYARIIEDAAMDAAFNDKPDPALEAEARRARQRAETQEWEVMF